MSEETADWIADTREYIEKNGWWKKAYRGPNGRQACVVGALLFSHDLKDDNYSDDRVRQAASAICKVIHPRPLAVGSLEAIYDWNDEKERTKQEVLDTLAKVEKIERAGFNPDAA